MKKDSGVTLVSLAITIIIIGILTSVVIYTSASAIERSHVSRFTADMKIVQSHVNSIYEEIKLGDISYYSTGRALDTLTTATKTQVDIALAAEGITETAKTDYRYFNESDLNMIGIEEIEREVLINFKTRHVMSVYPVEKDGELYYSQEALDGTKYNIQYDNTINTGNLDFELTNEKDGTKWKINVINIDFPGYVNTGTVSYKAQDDTNWKTATGYEFLVDEPGIYNVKLIDAEGNEATKNEYIYDNDGLILWYDALNNTGKGYSATTTTWKDLSGKGNDGILTGFDGTTSSGWQENYLRFDGVNDFVKTTTNLDFNNSTQMTFNFVDLNGTLNTNSLAMLFETSIDSNNNEGTFYIDTDEYGTNDIQFAMKYGNLINHKLADNILVTNESAIYTIVLNTTKSHDTYIEIYKNGISQSLTDKIEGDISGKTLADDILYIASRAGNLNFSRMDLACLRVYNTALTEDEIKTLAEIEKAKYID